MRCNPTMQYGDYYYITLFQQNGRRRKKSHKNFCKVAFNISLSETKKKFVLYKCRLYLSLFMISFLSLIHNILLLINLKSSFFLSLLMTLTHHILIPHWPEENQKLYRLELKDWNKITVSRNSYKYSGFRNFKKLLIFASSIGTRSKYYNILGELC